MTREEVIAETGISEERYDKVLKEFCTGIWSRTGRSRTENDFLERFEQSSPRARKYMVGIKQDDLDTVGHIDMMEGEMTAVELHCLDAFAQIRKGVPQEVALKSNGLTEKEYEENIEKAMSD